MHLLVSRRAGLVIALAGGCVIVLLLNLLTRASPPTAQHKTASMPVGAPERPREVVAAETAEDAARFRETESRIRATWEQRNEPSVFGALEWWAFCRTGMGVRIQHDLETASSDPGAPESRHIQAAFGGIEEKWWFRACVNVSPLIAKEPGPLPP